MLLGYMRVSRADGSQALDLQKDALLAAGVEPEHLYQDLASGKRDDRPGLAACLKALRKGDVLVAWKLDRLGRDLRHLVNLVHELTGRGAVTLNLGMTVRRGPVRSGGSAASPLATMLRCTSLGRRLPAARITPAGPPVTARAP